MIVLQLFLQSRCVMQRLATKFSDKRKKGLVKSHGSGYGGSGFRFDFHEDDAHNAIKHRHALEWKQPNDDGGGGGGDGGARRCNLLTWIHCCFC